MARSPVLLCAALLYRVKGAPPDPLYIFLNSQVLRYTTLHFTQYMLSGIWPPCGCFHRAEWTQDMLPELSDNNLRELRLNIGWRLRFRRAVSTLTQDNQDPRVNQQENLQNPNLPDIHQDNQLLQDTNPQTVELF